MTGKCDGSCTKRRVGCRTGCPVWEREEAMKEKRYAKKRAELDANYTSPMAIAGAIKNTRCYKQGRR